MELSHERIWHDPVQTKSNRDAIPSWNLKNVIRVLHQPPPEKSASLGLIGSR